MYISQEFRLICSLLPPAPKHDDTLCGTGRSWSIAMSMGYSRLFTGSVGYCIASKLVHLYWFCHFLCWSLLRKKGTIWKVTYGELNADGKFFFLEVSWEWDMSPNHYYLARYMSTWHTSSIIDKYLSGKITINPLSVSAHIRKIAYPRIWFHLLSKPKIVLPYSTAGTTANINAAYRKQWGLIEKPSIRFLPINSYSFWHRGVKTS